MDLNMIMRQAQNMQKEVEKTQKEIENTIFENISNGEMISVKVSGKKELVSLKISDEGFNALKDDKDLLEDMILSTVNGALFKAEEAMSKGMEKAGASLPGGMKLPF
ncbi:MAG: YbaB/EbfC family nucleoid-associated protein [Alphaproteobacteria bacterium]|jgi:DNA-binding YbaB/EbfC family protein|nr:YbaB/EbfC family nucleoid-associated protein [Alphaproteobacteria bacterium]